MAEPTKRGSKMVPVGVLLILLGLLAPAVTSKLGSITASLFLKMLFPILTDTFRLCFFIGVAVLLIGIMRNRRVKGFGVISQELEAESTNKVGTSKLGVASLSLAVLALLGILGGIAVSSVSSLANPDSGNSGVFLIAGAMMMSGMGLALVGGICGLVGTVQKKRKRGMAIAGLILNGMFVIGVIGLMFLGSMMS